MKGPDLPICCVCQRACFVYYKSFWGIVCKECYDLNLACFSCQRQLSKNQVLRLADFRIICSSCAASAVFELDPHLISETSDALKIIGVEVKKPVMFHVVDLDTLKKLGGRTWKTTELGLCSTTYDPNFRLPRAIEHKIFLLFGLPRQKLQGVLAHELHHAWLFEKHHTQSLGKEEAERVCDNTAYQLHQILKHEAIWLHLTNERI